jgi:hypothetical protein
MTLHARKSDERVNLGTFHAHKVLNPNPPHSQRIGDKRTVATPWNRFGAHYRAALLPGQFE